MSTPETPISTSLRREDVILFDTAAANLLQAVHSVATPLHRQNMQLSEQLDEARFKRMEAEQAQQWAETHDSLTGLPNLRYMSEKMRSRMENNEPFILMTLDWVLFKQRINDLRGHPNGNKFLQSWANFASANFTRRSDVISQRSKTDDVNVVARTGGDESMILVSLTGQSRNDEYRGTNYLDEMHAEYKYLHSVAADFITGSEWADSGVIASVGCAMWIPGSDLSLSDIITVSDASMYMEKRAQHQRLGLNGNGRYQNGLE